MKRFFPVICFLLAARFSFGQTINVTLSGLVKNTGTRAVLPFVNILLKSEKDSTFISGTITNEEGRFTLADVRSGTYLLEASYLGFKTATRSVVVGSLSPFLDLGVIELAEDARQLAEVTVSGQQADGPDNRMDKKTFSIAGNISQSGGSVLETMKSLPGVTVGQDGTVQLRGSDKVAVLIDGKQTALTGFGNQTSLDNIPASAIEKIEIINNPSARYDANGNAGIINIIYKKNKQEGFNGKVGLTAGLGALWVKKDNLPGIRPQYQRTPKLNPSLSLNYRKNKVNLFFQGDYLYTPTLNKNEFVDRFYDNGEVVRQQTKRNRNTTVATVKTGIDWNLNARNTLTVSGLFSSEKIIDRGDEPFFNGDLSQRNRLWQFLEDELKTTVTATAAYQHKFAQPSHLLNVGFNYTFHREDEKYFFTNILPDYTGTDSFKLLSDENVADLNVDYIRPLKYGRFETGLKLRRRYIPTNMQFFRGLRSPLDSLAGGWANYSETIPALYGNYVFENRDWEVEAGLRVEYVDLRYTVNPTHPTYKSDGYSYTQPFPNLRFVYKFDDKNRLSLFYNRRVDRPNEVDIRIFPKYDDAEIIKIGNPALKPQFTNAVELGYKTNWRNGYFYSALYHRATQGTITRIGTIVPGSTLIYNIFQNAGRSSNSGLEVIWQQEVAPWLTINTNASVYRNTINAFTVENKYPVPTVYSATKETLTSGNAKLNGVVKLRKQLDMQLTAVYLAPDLIPQGKIGSRFSVDFGAKKQLPKGEIFVNASDLFNTLRIRREVNGSGFHYVSTDYYETQVVRLGYSYKF
ncbi:TonB-dependent receptor domain-containing protein [Larkinella terrae]|uniref:TonB-dependent receptor n=1 Tax=Larkinella terrae TaxID=2025311 RepID=A0A7K0EGH2_9BACT|nr:outer membrane beta-barrel family protein [Larkinella terrae]MRS60914.1 TonB-dependent receptor [Larkinella terrae]